MDEQKDPQYQTHLSGPTQGFVQGEQNSVVINISKEPEMVDLTHLPQTRSPQKPTQQNRSACVQALHQEYRKQLEHSLQGAAMIAVGLHERTDVIRTPMQLVFRRLSTAVEHPLPSGISIIQVYDNAERGLLILGEPGAGKTTLLLELACELLSRAEGNSVHPIPVILNLSSWASKKAPLQHWLIDQLRLVYGIPSCFSQAWLEQDQWFLLLDGLDEVEETSRQACVEAINAYREEHFTPLVVCSRSNEYLSQDARLALSSAVVVQPLEEVQVTAYLERLGKSMAAVRAVVRDNPALRRLITTPLMLHVIVLAYRDKAIRDLPQLGSAKELQRQIFDRYVQRMLELQTTRAQFPPQQTQRWLIWLAQQMKQRHLTEFYLEWLQPSWLMTKRTQMTYRVFSGPIYGLIVGLIVGLIYRLIFGLLGGLTGLTGLIFGLIAGLMFGLMFGLIYGLIYGLMFGLIYGLIYGLMFGLLGGLMFGLLGGLMFGLLGGLMFGGQAYFRHYLLRYILSRSGVIPWPYVRFLEEKTECILLQRVGGGYRFVHALLLDYFASLETETSSDSAQQLQP